MAALIATAAPAAANAAGAWELGGDVAAELRLFPLSPEFSEQHAATASPSLRLEPEVLYRWNDGLDRLTFIPFGRWDLDDSHRTHFDVRELSWIHQAESWSLLVGVGRVFWGVTESRHLVDVINQDDLVEDIDGEDKLGQPLLNLTLERGWGALDLYLLLFFRERTFPDGDARLRGPLPVEGAPSYASDLRQWHPDWAVRWSRSLGEFDVGIAHFRGTSREPRFRLRPEPDELTLRPRYDVIDQTSLDLQWTHDAWLWKLEVIGRAGHGDYFGATVAGVEYTLFQVLDSPADLGLLAEYLYDGRDPDPTAAPPTLFDHDVFAGIRLALNNADDTQLLVGATLDTRSAQTLAVLEASHRLGESWLAELETRWFFAGEPDDFVAGLRRDSFIALRLSWFF